MTKFIVLDGKRYAWKEILKLRREQTKAAPTQPVLFELRDDSRPTSQRTAEGRMSEPTLFTVD